MARGLCAFCWRPVTMSQSLALERLRALGASALWVVYHDYAGLGRAKAVPKGRFADVATSGVSFAMANWDLIVNDHQVPHPAFGADSGDFWALPDPSFIVPVPGRPGVAQAAATLLTDTGEPWPGDPRALLAAQVDRLAARGIHVQTAFEAEFAIVPADRGPDGLLTDPSRMFTVDELDHRWALGERLLAALETAEIPVHQWAKEYGPGQFELSLLPADPVAAADRHLFARQVLRALSRELGLQASSMPKPFTDLPGNGLHVHLGLVGDDGTELVADPADDTALGPVGRAAVGGLLAHAAAQSALGSPTPNSYKRLLPGSWAPAHVAWALGNRAALVRIPGRGRGRHLEYRAGDGLAHPHLFLTGLLAAIADGLERGLEPPTSAAGIDVGHLTDAEARAQGFERLPDRLSTALDALEADSVLLAALGPVVPAHYLAAKRYELEMYREESGADEDTTEVTPWERATYFGVA